MSAPQLVGAAREAFQAGLNKGRAMAWLMMMNAAGPESELYSAYRSFSRAAHRAYRVALARAKALQEP